MESDEEEELKWSKINIRETYSDVLKDWDIISHKALWHKYNKHEPSEGDFIDVRDGYKMVLKVVDDGVSYLIKLLH